MERHLGLDWLRIGAFGILILYHIGMVFVPWGYHVTLQVTDWVVLPMLASNPWRLALLFVVSGYASRALQLRSKDGAGFARNRSARLLIPLLFGIIVVVPAQPWAELVSKYGYAGSFGYFYTHDYFVFGSIAGLVLPTWQHLWFVAYLWLYTIALVILLAASPAVARSALQHAFDRVFAGVGQFALPAAWLIVVSVILFPGGRETHALVDDGVAHAVYLPSFLFGFAMAASPRVLAIFARFWQPALALAIAAFALVIWVELRWPGDAMPPRPWGSIFSAGRAVQGWMTVAALIGIAERFWNRDHPWRAMLAEAVFPFYIIHQTVIVLVAFWLIGAGLPMATNFVLLILATVAGCWAFYLVGRRITWLRPLIGLRV